MQELETNQELNEKLLDMLDFIEDEEIEELGLEEANEEGFQIQNRDQAEYFLKKLKEMQAEMEEVKTYAKEYMAKQKEKISKWEESKLNEFEFMHDRYLNYLQEYAKNEIADSKKKSLKLVEGTLQFRKIADKYEYKDDVLLEYLQEQRDEILVSLEDLKELSIEDEEYGHVVPIKILAGFLKDANQQTFISTKESADKVALKKAGEEKNSGLYIDGEQVPGVTVSPQEESFSVK